MVSNAVVEFTSQQGVMGGYYATAMGENDEVAHAIRDHYRPRFAGDELPEGTEAYLAANDSAYLRCAVFACKDKDAAAAVKALIQSYIDESIDAKYNVDEVALLQKAKIHTMGRYVAVAVTDDTDNANKVIDRGARSPGGGSPRR